MREAEFKRLGTLKNYTWELVELLKNKSVIECKRIQKSLQWVKQTGVQCYTTLDDNLKNELSYLLQSRNTEGVQESRTFLTNKIN